MENWITPWASNRLHHSPVIILSSSLWYWKNKITVRKHSIRKYLKAKLIKEMQNLSHSPGEGLFIILVYFKISKNRMLL